MINLSMSDSDRTGWLCEEALSKEESPVSQPCEVLKKSFLAEVGMSAAHGLESYKP